MIRENRIRTIAKAVGYRTLSVVATWLVIQVLTGGTSQSFRLALWSNAATSVIYYLWERLWDRIDWGRS